MEHRWANINQFRFTTQSFKLFRMNFHPIMKCYPTLVEGWRNSRKRMRKKELCSFSWDWMIVMLPFMDKSYWCNLYLIHVEFTHLSFNKKSKLKFISNMGTWTVMPCLQIGTTRWLQHTRFKGKKLCYIALIVTVIIITLRSVTTYIAFQ